ncbi:MAG: alpha/beta hydrolase [Thaumarchaeota archaeon]|nr:alpha/beta hydrolase [Nitrososphaerota archaeon]
MVSPTDVSSLGMPFEISGSQIESTIVLVPGGLTGWLSWEPHAKQLSQNYRVVRVQLLSVDLGLRNESLPRGYSVDYETNALARTIEQNRLSQAHFVAWSYGAEVTLNYALNNPDKVRTLTLIEPPAIWVLRSRGPLSRELMEEQKKIQSLGSGDVSESQLEWFTHFAGFVPANVDPKKLPQWPVWLKHRNSLRTGDVVYRHEDDIQRVRNFKKPVMLFKGGGFFCVSPSNHRHLGKRVSARKSRDAPRWSRATVGFHERVHEYPEHFS